MARRRINTGFFLRLLVLLAIVLLIGALAYSFWQKNQVAETQTLELADSTNRSAEGNVNAQTALAKASVDALRSRDDMIESQAVELENLTARVEEMAGEIDGLKTEIAGRDETIQQLQDDLASARADVASMLQAREETAADEALENQADETVTSVTEVVSDEPEPLESDAATVASVEEAAEEPVEEAVESQQDGTMTDVTEVIAVESEPLEPAAATESNIEEVNEEPVEEVQAAPLGLSDEELEQLFPTADIDTGAMSAADGVSAYSAANYQLAGNIWHALAKTGNARSQFHFGGMLAEGRLAAPDPITGYRFLRLANEGGYGAAEALMNQIAGSIDPATLERLNAEN